MKYLAVGLLTIIVAGYACLGGHLAYNFVQGVQNECVVPMTRVVLNLSEANKSLNVKIEIARSIVRRVQSENCQLKNAVRDGAKMLQDQIDENDTLYQKLENLQWHINTLEKIIKDTP